MNARVYDPEPRPLPVGRQRHPRPVEAASAEPLRVCEQQSLVVHRPNGPRRRTGRRRRRGSARSIYVLDNGLAIQGNRGEPRTRAGDPAALPTVPVITGSGGTLKLPLSSFGAMFTPTFAGGANWDQALSQSGNLSQGFAPESPAAAALGGTESGPAGGDFANGGATAAFANAVQQDPYVLAGLTALKIDGRLLEYCGAPCDPAVQASA